MSVKGTIHKDYRDNLTGATYMFSGLNNVIDPYNLPLDKGELPVAINVDIDNTNSISRRSGYSLSLTGTNTHSGWSDGQTAFYVEGMYLKQFDGVEATIIDMVTANIPMWYIKANNVVVYSNGIESGIIGGSLTQTHTYSEEFKRQTNFGTLLCFYNGRIYHAKDNSVFCTDTFDVEHTDVRHSHVLTVASKITMIKYVEDGLYVGSEEQTHFLRGNDILDGGFELEIIADYGVVLGTAISSVGEYFPESKGRGTIAIWTGSRGICTGAAGGNFINHSLGTLSIPECYTGSSLIRDVGGYRQYITTLNTNGKDEYNPYPTPTFDINTI